MFASNNVTINGNEANQSGYVVNTHYLTGWHTSALGGGSGLWLTNSYITRGGNRGVDWRGVTNYHVNHNQWFNNGMAVGGTGVSKGNSLSVDIGVNSGNILSVGGECLDNINNTHGDSFKCGNSDFTVSDYTYYGAEYAGQTPFRAAGTGAKPWYTETGVDGVGSVRAQFGNIKVFEAFNSPLNLNSYASVQGTADVQVSNSRGHLHFRNQLLRLLWRRKSFGFL